MKNETWVSLIYTLFEFLILFGIKTGGAYSCAPGGATPPWTPPSGPAGAGRVGVITRGGIVDPFWLIFCDFSNFWKKWNLKFWKKICQNVEKSMPNMSGWCPKHVQIMSETCPNDVRNIPKSCPKHVQIMPKTCLNHVRNMPKSCLKHA